MAAGAVVELVALAADADRERSGILDEPATRVAIKLPRPMALAAN